MRRKPSQITELIFFLPEFHRASAFSCYDRVVSFEAEKWELEFLKTWCYLEIIDLRPDRGMGSLPRIIHLRGGGGGAELTPQNEAYTVLEYFVIPISY